MTEMDGQRNQSLPFKIVVLISASLSGDCVQADISLFLGRDESRIAKVIKQAGKSAEIQNCTVCFFPMEQST